MNVRGVALCVGVCVCGGGTRSLNMNVHVCMQYGRNVYPIKTMCSLCCVGLYPS